MTNDDIPKILETSDDPKLLASAAAKLAESAVPADLELLSKWLPRDDFLNRLNRPEEYDGARHQLRLRRPLQKLRENPSVRARAILLGLVRNQRFTSVGTRAELLIEATVSIRPAPPELVAFWDAHSQPEDGFTPLTIAVVVENGSQPALDLFERKVSDPGHEADEKVSWFREDVLVHRDNAALLATCERILVSSVSETLKAELVSVLFDYRPGEWFTPAVNYTPPASIPPEARVVLERIARYVIDHVELTDGQLAPVRLSLQSR